MYIVLLNQSKLDYDKHSDDRKAIPMWKDQDAQEGGELG